MLRIELCCEITIGNVFVLESKAFGHNFKRLHTYSWVFSNHQMLHRWSCGMLRLTFDTKNSA